VQAVKEYALALLLIGMIGYACAGILIVAWLWCLHILEWLDVWQD